MLLLETLIEQAAGYILQENPLPLDLMVKLESHGIIIEDLERSVLAQYMYKDI